MATASNRVTLEIILPLLFSLLFINLIYVGQICWPEEGMAMNRERLCILTGIFKKVFRSSGSDFPIVICCCYFFFFKIGFVSVNVVCFCKGLAFFYGLRTFWKVCLCAVQMEHALFTLYLSIARAAGSSSARHQHHPRTLPAGWLPSPGGGTGLLLRGSLSIKSIDFLPFYFSIYLVLENLREPWSTSNGSSIFGFHPWVFLFSPGIKWMPFALQIVFFLKWKQAHLPQDLKSFPH